MTDYLCIHVYAIFAFACYPGTHCLAHKQKFFHSIQCLVYSERPSITRRDPPRSKYFDPSSASSLDPYLPESVRAARSYLAERQLEVDFSQQPRHPRASPVEEAGPEEAVAHRQSA